MTRGFTFFKDIGHCQDLYHSRGAPKGIKSRKMIVLAGKKVFNKSFLFSRIGNLVFIFKVFEALVSIKRIPKRRIISKVRSDLDPNHCFKL